MNGTITLPIDAELAGWLKTGAASRGIKVEDFALDALRRVARKPTINEVFADVQADFKASGMTEDELGDLLEKAVAEVRAEHRD